MIHDLAILKINDDYDDFLELGDSEFPKGTKVFSMGNPHDLGMSIVEGTYNGLLEKTMYRKIHFSGSLNGGMSGGPALDNKGHVIGINVATYGNQLSFLVPVDYLRQLFETIKDTKDQINDFNWNHVIEQQLTKNQAEVVDGIISSSWESLPMGNAQVPGEMTSLFKCWGDSKEDDNDELYQWTALRCSSQDDIFIAHDLRTGQIIYNYLWITSKGLNPFRFYRVFESSFMQTYQFENAKEEDVENFKCQTSFVKLAGEHFKTILCARPYKKFPLLYDVNLNLASVDEYKKGLLVELVLLGVTKEKSQALVRKFMESIQWTK
ncbi:MAG: trypsin-like peptidase domain-containing protein [Candidatus Omnitrophica bacterium]|nr:trypsin-like peptidase domain-containing protein [Candidatus Omnitrophota bacterium]